MTVLAVSEISAASPDMSEKEFRLFVEDIRSNGQLVPIVVCGGEVIDGRKRLAACRELGIEPKTVDMTPGLDPEQIGVSLNVLRTHYTKSQRGVFAAKRSTLGRGQYGRHNSTNGVMAPDNIPANAKAMGVSPSYVSLAKEVMAKADPSVVKAVEDGKLSLTTAAKIIKTVPKSEQAERIKRAHPSASLPSFADGKAHKSSPRRSSDKIVGNCLVSIDEALNSLERVSADINPEQARAPLSKSRTRISRLLNQMGE